MSLVGKKIEEFSTDAYLGGKFIKVSDKDFYGKWSVLCFYPADFSFVCPTELEDLEETYPTLKSLGVEVYSASTDTHFVHAAWHEHSDAISKITYPMLADPSQKISRAFDVLDEEAVLDVMQVNWSIRLKLLNMCVIIQGKFVPLSGKRTEQVFTLVLTL